MSTLGIFNTTNFAPEEVLLQSFQGAIFRKYPGGQAPLLGFTSMSGTGTLAVPEHAWQIDSQEFPHSPVTAEVPACAAGTASMIAVANALQFVQGAVLQVNGTMEHLRVQTVVDEFHILAKRGYGTIPPQVIPAGTELWRVSSAFEESSLRPQARVSGNDRKITNITQIFRDAWAVSGTAAAAKLTKYGTNPVQKNRASAALQHATDMEFNLIFGQRKETTENGQPLRKMSGAIELIREHAPDNYHLAPDVMTMSMFEDMLDPVFDFNTDAANANDRVLFCGKVGRKFVNKLGNYSGQKWLQPTQTKFGHRFDEFITTRGNYKVMEHPLFNINPDWARMILVLDISTFKMLHLEGRKTAHRSFNAAVNSGMDKGDVDAGIDAEGGSFLTEATLEMSLPEANAVIMGVCDAACEPCPTLPTTYQGAFSISHPCYAGPVAGGTVVTLSLVTNKPSTAFNIVTPNGIVTLTSAGGEGNQTLTTTYTLPAYAKNAIQGVDPWGNANGYTFAIVNGPALSNVAFDTAAVTACVKDPCEDPSTVVNPEACAVICATDDNAE